MARPLTAEEVRRVSDPAALGFRSTAELAPLDGVIGQDRALDATTFGVRMRHAGYNLFVLGPAATGKTTTMRRLLADAAAAEPVPSDWCYVHNFTDPYRPTALELPAGRGRALRDAMTRLVEECKIRLPRAFETEEFERRRAEITEGITRRQAEEVARLEEAARAEGCAIVRTPAGLSVAPAPLGKPISSEEFASMPEPMQEKILAAGRLVGERLETMLRTLRQCEREGRSAHEQLVREVATVATRQLIQELRDDFAGLAAVQTYLTAVEADIIDHAEQFRAPPEERPQLPFLPPVELLFERYRVNVIVDRSGAAGAPVVFEPNPTHGNLLGRIEHRAQFGALVTDFTLVKGGALHQANGGYLILEAKDVLHTFLAWDALKKALKSRSIRIQEPLEELRLATVVSLAPEPIPLVVKVVLIGTPLLYYLLYQLDEDFCELFKVKVDFDDSFPRTPESEALYARFVAATCRDEGLRHFAASAVAALVEHGARLVEHQDRLSARLGVLQDVVREAAVLAAQRGADLVERVDVDRALAERIRRVNLLEERLGRLVSEGSLLIATEGDAVGQVNGISVLSTGDHAFGRPSRITVRTYSGAPGVVDIEREAKLGGRIHSKGVMILTGFLAGRYARERPLTLAASIAFEQQYEEIEGDSASSAELYALLSSLAGIPLSQALAVTGSVNQQGEIQPVGGINEKIEGFFDVCRRRGLTGRQGVLIPAANVRHLMLRDDVVAAIRAERFQVWTVSTVDEGLALLSGREAGERREGRYPAGTFNAAVDDALAAGVVRLRQLRGDGAAAAAVAAAPDRSPLGVADPQPVAQVIDDDVAGRRDEKDGDRVAPRQ
jgi:lon-related putative ATP-dependent protease